MSNLNIRGISPTLLRDFKVKAAVEGKTLRAWVLEKLISVKADSSVTREPSEKMYAPRKPSK